MLEGAVVKAKDVGQHALVYEDIGILLIDQRWSFCL